MIHWNAAHRRYKCGDSMLVEVPCRTSAYVLGTDKNIIRPSNIIKHVWDVQERPQPRTVVSGV